LCIRFMFCRSMWWSGLVPSLRRGALGRCEKARWFVGTAGQVGVPSLDIENEKRDAGNDYNYVFSSNSIS
jgi:hypothetical protein